MNKNLYLGIDVSKGYADFCLVNSDKQLIGDQFQLFDVEEGYQGLETYLHKIVTEHNPEQTYVASESTGGYENHWLDKLYSLAEKYPIKVARLNPIGVSKHRQAEMRRQITDKSSSEIIARYLVNHAEKLSYYSPDSFKKFRLYLNHINMLTKQKNQLSNKLHQYLYWYFPEILSECRSGFTTAILKLIENYPTSITMAKSRKGSQNITPYFSISRRDNLRERCKNNSIGEDDPLIASIIKDTSRQIQELNRKIDEMYKQLYKKIPQEKLDILTTMPGVAQKTASILFSIIGDISRIENARQLLGFFGLHPVIKESGDVKKKSYLSKRGNSLLRKHLYMSAMTAALKDPYLRSIYLEAVEKGMAKRAALCKIMAKMLRMIYGMLTNNQCYNSLIDANHREKYMKKKASERGKSGRSEVEEERMLAIAPISRKNAKYRKEQSIAYNTNSKFNR